MISVNIVFVVFSILSLYLFYKYLTRNHDYWLNRGLRGPWPIPGLGTIIYYLMDNRSKVDVKWFKTFGKIYGVFEGNTPVLYVAEPQLIKQILVKDFHLFTDRMLGAIQDPILDKNLVVLKGKHWKRVRSLLSPTFSSGKLKKMYPLVRECLKDFMCALELLSMNGNEVNMKKMYGQYTLDVIATCAFATKTHFYNNPNDLFITNAMNSFSMDFVSIACNWILPKSLLKLFSNKLTPNQLREYFFDIIRGIIRERKNCDKSFDDFIELMMNLEKSEDNVSDDNDINESHHMNEGEEESEVVKKTFIGIEKYMTENEIIGNAYAFLMAGYENTAATLSHCTQELALNPEIQEKLYSEIMTSVDSNGEIDYDLLSKLPYLDAVISETQRLHSAIFYLERISSADCKLGDTGITILKGQRVQVPIYAVHRCEEYYPNPDQFIPERFLPENRHKILPYTYLPFGAGPRNCIGIRLALMEIKLVLAQIVKHFIIKKSRNTDIPVKLAKQFLLNAPSRLIVSMIKRI